MSRGLNAAQRKKVSSGRITDAAEVMTEQTLNLIKHILLKHETAQLEVMAEMKEEIESMRHQLAECEREREEARLFHERENMAEQLATVTAERDELVAVLELVEPAIRSEVEYQAANDTEPSIGLPVALSRIQEALAKLGADKTGEQQ